MKVESNFGFRVFVYYSKVCCCNAYNQCSSKAGVGKRQSIAGRIDCMVLSAGHIHSQFDSFVLKMHNITSQIY